MVYVKDFLFCAILNGKRACVRYGIAYLCICHPCIFHYFFEFILVFVGYLYYDTRILCKEGLNDIITVQVMQVNVESACCVGK